MRCEIRRTGTLSKSNEETRTRTGTGTSNRITREKDFRRFVQKIIIMKSSLVGVLLALPRNRGNWISKTSYVVGFSPSAVTRRNCRNTNWSPIGPCSYRADTATRRRTFVSGQDDNDSKHDSNNVNDDSTEENAKNNWLIVGDGDLSYSASIAEDLANENVRLFATVLEEEQVHDSVYKRSSQNKADILFHPKRHTHDRVVISNTTNEHALATTAASTNLQSQHQVLFGIDATKLKDHFPTTKFKTIEFNFPHWKGKTNAKRNRQLLDTFMGSAAKVLHEEGEIIISLCQGQGGFPASTGMSVHGICGAAS